MNLYGFSMNNPLRYVDPDGLAPRGDEDEEDEPDPYRPPGVPTLSADAKAALSFYDAASKVGNDINNLGKDVEAAGDTGGLVPFLDGWGDLASAAGNAMQGHWGEAGLSMAAIFIPIPALSKADEVVDAAKTGRLVDDVVDNGWTEVSRWMSAKEAKLWKGRSSIPQPSAGSGLPPKTYVTGKGVPQPGGTGPVRVDFSVPTGALDSTQSGWFAIWNQFRSVPIRDVKVPK